MYIDKGRASLYVWQASPSPTAPYSNWAKAAHTIQDAVDAALGGDTVLVTNGIYASGGRAVDGTLTNRVAAVRPITVISVKGPTVTVIVGAAAPGGGLGDGAIRCAYLGTNTVLSGFTLTNGHTQATAANQEDESGGGVMCALPRTGVVTNCTLSGNSAVWGGGAYDGTLNNCTLSGNSASSFGGGVVYSTLNNCAVSSNSAGDSAGAFAANLNNCTLTGNSALSFGGGASYSTLNNCTLTGNSAWEGGGAYSGTLNNCIVYYNMAPFGPNYYWATFAYSCTTPFPGPGNNIEAEPLLASGTHLSAQSPCIGRGSAVYSSGVDIDGEAWLNPPCIGADQFVAGQSGPLTISIAAGYTNVSVGLAVSFQALTAGKLAASVWDFRDGVVVSNRPYASHTWAIAGQYQVRLTGYNENYPSGVSATVLVQVAAQNVYYVNAANTSPISPFTNWPGAATNIQDAIDAGSQLGRLVLVADGFYGSGGRALAGWPLMTNRVVLPEGVEVRSVNGSAVTIISGAGALGGGFGDGAIRCAYVGSNALLSGFTLTNGHTRLSGDYEKEQGGGGVWCEASAVISNCSLRGNSAYNGGGLYSGTANNSTVSDNSAAFGGGLYYGTLNNCVVSGNSAAYSGGAYLATLNHCTVTDNSASESGGGVDSCMLNDCTVTRNSAMISGGGADSSTLKNCIAYYNTAPTNENYDASTFTYSCAAPLPPGLGNMTNEPGFVNLAGGNLRLQTNSPCINAGDNASAAGTTDLDGRPRIVGGVVDIGAYQFQGAGMGEFIGWLQQFGQATDGSADYIDPDHDGLNNWQEWVANTNPTDALSSFRIAAISFGPPVVVQFTSSLDRLYTLKACTNLAAPVWLDFPGQTGVPGSGGLQSLMDTNVLDLRFYRVGVSLP